MPEELDDIPSDELPPYLANLGLLSDPFVDVSSGNFIYVGADGEQRLDLMHHLAPYSPLLVVIGELGIGKTVLLRQFAARAKDNWRIIAITARIEMDRDDLIRTLSEALGLSVQNQVDPNARLIALIAQLRALRQTAQVPILLIDDAQVLSVSSLELIQRLCSENDDGHIISVILFGTPQLQSLWNRETLAPLAARVTHTFEMAPYSEEETTRYIRHRFSAAGASGDGPFDTITMNKIYAATGGIPSKINEIARKTLMDRNMGNKRRQVGSAQTALKGPKQRHRVITLISVIVVVLLLAGPLRSILFKSTPLPPSQPPQHGSSLAVPPSVAPDSGKGELVMRSNDEHVKDNSKASSQAEEGTPPTTSPEVKALPLPPEDTTIVMDSAPTERGAPIPEKSEPPLKTEPAPPPNTQVAETKPATASSLPQSKIKDNNQNIKRGRGTSDWISAQVSSNYTLQLMAVKNESTARKFILSHDLNDKAAYFPVKSKGQTLYAVIYGSFSQRSEAVRAAKSLPSAWDTPNPWIRRFRSLPTQSP